MLGDTPQISLHAVAFSHWHEEGRAFGMTDPESPRSCPTGCVKVRRSVELGRQIHQLRGWWTVADQADVKVLALHYP
jgi:hypothetical protein